MNTRQLVYIHVHFFVNINILYKKAHKTALIEVQQRLGHRRILSNFLIRATLAAIRFPIV